MNRMRNADQRMEAQLGLWGLKIETLAAKALTPGIPIGFETLMRIDELKALFAIAQSRFEDFRAAGHDERAGLEVEMKLASDELDAAFEKARPHRKRRNAQSETDR
jgi:hypothetical protein